MKKMLLASALLATLVTSAQENKVKEQPAGGFKSFAAVKWNPASLAFGKLSLFGEYNFKNRKSLTVGIGIPMEQSFNFDIDKKDTELKTKTTSAMVGYRMYMGKKTMSGFYFEPYAKYTKNELATILTDVEVGGGQKANFSVSSEYSGFGGGFQLGAQMLIAKRITLDLLILGVEGSSAKHNIIMQDLNPSIAWTAPDAEQRAEQEIQEILNDVPVIGKKIGVEANKNAKTITTSYKGFLPGYRGGITVGIRF